MRNCNRHGLLRRLGAAGRHVGNADDVKCIHRVRGVALIHDGNDALAHGDEVTVRHLELPPVGEMNHERREWASQPVTERIQIQHGDTLASDGAGNKRGKVRGASEEPFLSSTLGCLFLIVFKMQPPDEQAVKIVGGAVVLLLAVWFGLEHRRFKGPPQTAPIAKEI